MEERKFCTVCGSHLEPGAKFCTNCGTKVEVVTAAPVTPSIVNNNPVGQTPVDTAAATTKVCPTCGKEIAIDAKFCTGCGSRIED